MYCRYTAINYYFFGIIDEDTKYKKNGYYFFMIMGEVFQEVRENWGFKKSRKSYMKPN